MEIINNTMTTAIIPDFHSFSNIIEGPTKTDNITTPTVNILSKNQKATVPISSVVSFTLGVLGNILAIIVLVRFKKKHKWGIFSRFVISLALTDLFGIITTSPVVFAFCARKVNLSENVLLCHYMAVMMIFAGLATVLLVSAMAVDRSLAVLLPLTYYAIGTRTFANSLIIGVWVFSLLVAILPLLGFGENVAHYPFSWCFFNYFGDKTEDKIYGFFYSSLGLGSIFLTIVLNLRVLARLISESKSNVRRESISNRRARSKKDISIAIFLIMIVIVFTVCWAPFMIRIIINQSRIFPRDVKADILSLTLASWNQVLDPWVYLLFRGNTLTRLLRCIKKSSFICKTFGCFNCSSSGVSNHDSTSLQFGAIPLTSMVNNTAVRCYPFDVDGNRM
ncbi:thromboxane A2 receptor-like [Mytilus californianus]|uniref:thromboxane A2 receptor-like n=1 Tax=Mytilus californianus TaxID=6549 RepID=UPI002247CD0B|nr:thromboxane A2 receptor-like [Mytilus californianus]